MRAAFFLWLTVVNLVALSTVWARIADVFGSGASKRLFGFLGAGATCGGGLAKPPQSIQPAAANASAHEGWRSVRDQAALLTGVAWVSPA